MQVSLEKLLDKFGIKLILDISKELFQGHTLLNVACQYHEEDCNPCFIHSDLLKAPHADDSYKIN